MHEFKPGDRVVLEAIVGNVFGNPKNADSNVYVVVKLRNGQGVHTHPDNLKFNVPDDLEEQEEPEEEEEQKDK